MGREDVWASVMQTWECDHPLAIIRSNCGRWPVNIGRPVSDILGLDKVKVRKLTIPPNWEVVEMTIRCHIDFQDIHGEEDVPQDHTCQ